MNIENYLFVVLGSFLGSFFGEMLMWSMRSIFKKR
jgi:hypothetical protein